MKRYILFAGYEYESAGGMRDMIAISDTLPRLLDYADRIKRPHKRGHSYQWWHIFDVNDGSVVDAWSYDDTPAQEIKSVTSDMDMKVIE